MIDSRPNLHADDVERAKELLTGRQYEAWRLWVTGAGYKRISLVLRIAPESARDRIRRAQQKLGAV